MINNKVQFTKRPKRHSVEEIMNVWKKFLTETATKAFYTGAIVEDVEYLKNKLDDLKVRVEGWKDSSISIIHKNEQLNHHMTIVPSPADKSKEPIDLGSKPELIIDGFGVDEELGIAAWRVKTDIKVQSGVPHITAMLRDETVKPHLAAKIKNWKDVDPFPVKTTIKEVFIKL